MGGFQETAVILVVAAQGEAAMLARQENTQRREARNAAEPARPNAAVSQTTHDHDDQCNRTKSAIS
jgi:uncharacterized protein GlcG (DUF336 family)